MRLSKRSSHDQVDLIGAGSRMLERSSAAFGTLPHTHLMRSAITGNWIAGSFHAMGWLHRRTTFIGVA